MSSMLSTVLVVGVVIVVLMKRCEWLQLCGDLGSILNGDGSASQTSDSTDPGPNDASIAKTIKKSKITDKHIHKKSGTSLNPKKIDKVLKKIGQSDKQTGNAISQTGAPAAIAASQDNTSASCHYVPGQGLVSTADGSPCKGGLSNYVRVAI